MIVTTFSSREFNQDTGRAKKAAADGPVFITDRGKPAHVLLSIDEYRRISGQPKRSLLDALSMSGLDEINLEAELARPHEPPRIFDFDVADVSCRYKRNL